MIKKYEVRITKIVTNDKLTPSKEVIHACHYFNDDEEKEAKKFFDTWKPSTRLIAFRVRLITITESVEKIRETTPIIRRLTKLKKK
jgi:hypothetical protein